MLEPREISEKKFEKSVVWGYDIQSVDAFLSVVAADYAALQAENQKLVGQVRVLVKKIEEYRGMEDELRRSMSNAQNQAAAIVENARQQAAQQQAAADATVAQKIHETDGKLATQEMQLEDVKTSQQAFVQKMIAAYQSQLRELQAMESVFEEELEAAEAAARKAAEEAAARKAAEEAARKAAEEAARKAAEEAARKAAEEAARKAAEEEAARKAAEEEAARKAAEEEAARKAAEEEARKAAEEEARKAAEEAVAARKAAAEAAQKRILEEAAKPTPGHVQEIEEYQEMVELDEEEASRLSTMEKSPLFKDPVVRNLPPEVAEYLLDPSKLAKVEAEPIPSMELKHPEREVPHRRGGDENGETPKPRFDFTDLKFGDNYPSKGEEKK